MKTRFRFFLTVITALVLVTSCSEEDAASVLETSYDSEEGFAALEQEILTVERWEDNEDALANGRVDTDDFLLTPECVTKTWELDSANRTRILTIDFGDEPCLGRDGLYRKGKIVITYVGGRQHPGSTKTTEFIGYFVMNHEFNGIKHIEFQGNHVYSRDVDMTHHVGQDMWTWQADQLVEMIAGYLTPEKHDDLFQVTGDGSGINKNGIAYTAEITEPLLRKVQPGCHKNFVDGVVTFTNENEVVTILDYDPIGGAPCDKLASLTRNGNTRFITLW